MLTNLEMPATQRACTLVSEDPHNVTCGDAPRAEAYHISSLLGLETDEEPITVLTEAEAGNAAAQFIVGTALERASDPKAIFWFWRSTAGGWVPAVRKSQRLGS